MRLRGINARISVQNVGFAATSTGVGGVDHAIQRIDLKYGSFGTKSRTKHDDFWMKGTS